MTAIKKAVKHIRNNDSRPTRVSLAEIIRAVGHRGALEQRLHKLPRTAKALDNHLESLEAFAIRKIAWAESCYEQEAVCPTRLQIMVRAGIRNKAGQRPVVQSAVDSTLERLNKKFR